jgi:hypothetical protein
MRQEDKMMRTDFLKDEDNMNTTKETTRDDDDCV